MISFNKVLIFITLIMPILITSILLSLYNFGVDSLSQYVPLFGSFIYVNSDKTNPIVNNPKVGSIINGIWYLLTFIACIFVTLLIFKKDNNQVI